MEDQDHKSELDIFFENLARANKYKGFRELEILFCLYEHKSLTEAQLQRVAAPHVRPGIFRNELIEMAAKQLLLRKKEKLANETYYFRLANDGLKKIIDKLEIEDRHNINYNQPEDYYKNHYLQNWMTRFLYNDKLEGIYRPHCDARQFPFNNLIGEAAYRPDWIIFNSNDKYSDMMFKEDFKSNPLFYPYQYHHLKKWNIDLTPLMMLECVTVNMNVNDLKEKWELVKTNLDYIVKTLVVFSPKGKVKSTRDTLIEILEKPMCESQLHVIVGDEQLTIEASHYYELNKEKFDERNELDWNSLLDSGSNAENAPTLLNRAIGLYQEELHPVLEEYIVCRKPDLSVMEVQFIFHSFPGWLNPHAKMQKLKKRINYDTVPLKFILLYPSKEVLLSDKILPDTDEYFVLKDEISACGWGPAYQFITGKNGTTKWIKADLL